MKDIHLYKYKRSTVCVSKHIIIALICLCHLNAQAQFELANEKMVCDSCNNHVLFEFSSSNFIKNNEYDSPYVTGSTHIGYFIQPVVSYILSPKFKIKTGVFLLQFSGRDSYSDVIPIFSVSYNLNESALINFGAINGSLAHRLEEPLFRYDRFFQNQVEYGLQFRQKTERWFVDTWLNWEEFIQRGDDFQERFQWGLVSEWKALDRGISLTIPIHMLADHKGGEIDISNEGVSTIFNAMAGLRMAMPIMESASVSFEPLYFMYKGVQIPESGANIQAYDSGYAYSLGLAFENKFLYSKLSYWKAHQFIAPLGEYLYHSVGEFDQTIMDEDRNLLNAKVYLRKQFDSHIQGQFRVDAYYDKDNSSFNHALGLYLLIDFSATLTKIKNKH